MNERIKQQTREQSNVKFESFENKGTDKALTQTVNEPIYLDDPIMTFEDSMVYGCSMYLNNDELKEFC